MIAYYTTIWTPYHETICRELNRFLGDDFRLVLTRPVDRNGNLGWSLCPPHENWIIQPPETTEPLEGGVWVEMILSADVAIIGGLVESSALFAAVDRRVGSGKLTFFMGERPFKKGIHAKDFFRPYNWYVWWRLHRRYDRKNVHFLAIGKGVQEDLRFLRVSKAHVWKWAYFPAVSKFPAVKTDSRKLKICWCGRMIPCKNVDVMIRAIGLLPDEDRKCCSVTIAGEGETKESCVSLASELGLMDTIDFRPVLPHDDVLYLMSESDVYVFPSNGEEGWGVALEEAMDQCCVPVACEEAGASVLIEDGVSGFLFKNGDAEALSIKLAWLLRHPAQRHEMGGKAWGTVQRWSPETGAGRIIEMINCFSNGGKYEGASQGLCSLVS